MAVDLINYGEDLVLKILAALYTKCLGCAIDLKDHKHHPDNTQEGRCKSTEDYSQIYTL